MREECDYFAFVLKVDDMFFYSLNDYQQLFDLLIFVV